MWTHNIDDLYHKRARLGKDHQYNTHTCTCIQFRLMHYWVQINHIQTIQNSHIIMCSMERIGSRNEVMKLWWTYVPLSDWCPNFSFLRPSLLPWLPPPHWIRIESSAGESTPGDSVRCWWAWLWAEFIEGGPDSGVVREWVKLRAAGCITGRHFLKWKERILLMIVNIAVS